MTGDNSGAVNEDAHEHNLKVKIELEFVIANRIYDGCFNLICSPIKQ